MKNIFIAIICLLFIVSCHSSGLVIIEGKKYTQVEKMPEFPGGEKAMFDFIGKNLRYPTKAIEANITGKVFVNFVIDKKGNVTDIKILRGIGYGCDEEVIRVIGLMPNWSPGKQKGKRVKVSFNLPISFNLRD